MANPFLATYEDFENYFLDMKSDTAIGVVAATIGDERDAQIVQQNANGDEIYPLLFVHVPTFQSFRASGNRNRFESAFAVLLPDDTDVDERRRLRDQARNIVLNIQKKMEIDALNGLFDFNGVFDASPLTGSTMGKCLGWFVEFSIATPGVGADSDYR